MASTASRGRGGPAPRGGGVIATRGGGTANRGGGPATRGGGGTATRGGGTAPRGGGAANGGVLGGLPARPPPPAAWVTIYTNDWTVADQDLVFQHYPAPNTNPPMPQFPAPPNYPDYHMYQNFYDIANICYSVGQFKRDRKACMAAMVFMRQGAWNIWKMREDVKAKINTPDPEHDHEIQIWEARFNDWNQQFRKPGVMAEYTALKTPAAATPNAQGAGTAGAPRGGGNAGTRGRGGGTVPRGGGQQQARGGGNVAPRGGAPAPQT